MNEMRKKSCRLMRLVSVIFGLIVITQGMVCSAADVTSVRLEVCQEITGGTKEDADVTFTYELTGKDSDIPMPEGTKEGKYVFQISGTDKMQIDPIQFIKGGVYVYEIVRKSEVEGYLCGEDRYTVMIYVKNTEQGLTPTCIYETGEGKKTGELLFTYEKEKEEKPEGVQTGDAMESGELVMFVLLGLAGVCIMIYEGKKQII